MLYRSNLVHKRTRNRSLYAGKDETRSGRIFLPAGTVLTTSDDLLFVPLGENQAVKKMNLLVVGDTSTIAGSVGRFQIVDAAGTPVSVQRLGPLGDAGSIYTSPATSAAAYKGAEQLDGYTETIIAAPIKEVGPVNVGIRITTGGTIAADTEIFLSVMVAGEDSVNVVDAEYLQSYADNGYLIGQ